jgi:hypothetical protein
MKAAGFPVQPGPEVVQAVLADGDGEGTPSQGERRRRNLRKASQAAGIRDESASGGVASLRRGG